MSLLTSGAAGILKPEEVARLVIEPLQNASTAMQISTVVPTASHQFRIPIVVADAGSGWYSEGSDITPTDAQISELVVTPTKLATLSKVSNELANDSSPTATAVVGQGMARDLARKLDTAFFANTTANGPSGLLSLGDVQTVDGSSAAGLDAFAEAISKLESVGSTCTAFCASAATVLELSQLKQFDGVTQSNVPLLSQAGDGTAATKRQILGVNLWPLPAGVIADGVVWALDAAKTFVVLRQDAQVEVDRSVFFGSDSLGVRSVLRVGFGWPHQEAVVQIGLDGS